MPVNYLVSAMTLQFIPTLPAYGPGGVIPYNTHKLYPRLTPELDCLWQNVKVSIASIGKKLRKNRDCTSYLCLNLQMVQELIKFLPEVGL